MCVGGGGAGGDREGVGGGGGGDCDGVCDERKRSELGEGDASAGRVCP